MVPVSDDDFSEFGEDVDLPSGDGVTGTEVKRDIHSGTVQDHSDGARVESLAQKNDPHLEEEDVYDVEDIDQ